MVVPLDNLTFLVYGAAFVPRFVLQFVEPVTGLFFYFFAFLLQAGGSAGEYCVDLG